MDIGGGLVLVFGNVVDWCVFVIDFVVILFEFGIGVVVIVWNVVVVFIWVCLFWIWCIGCIGFVYGFCWFDIFGW